MRLQSVLGFQECPMLTSRQYRRILNTLEKAESLVSKTNKVSSQEDVDLLEGILKLGEVVEELQKRARLAELTSPDADYAQRNRDKIARAKTTKKPRSLKQKSRKR